MNTDTVVEASAQSQVPSLSDGGYEMLLAAVNTARQHQCKSIATLRERLERRWPDRKDEIAEAISYWAYSVRERHPEGVPDY